MTNNPLGSGFYRDEDDLRLITQALNGNKSALGELCNKHRPFIYNLVWKMVLNPQNAEDITQDILIKVITKLSQFNHKSQFRTWLYRIAVNHVLNVKKQFRELEFTDFDSVANVLDSLQDNDHVQTPEDDAIVEDVRISCTAGMLLCLDREQRITFILGAIFHIDHNLGAEILEISPANFRQRLSRARKDLQNFMHNKCGLVNTDNPCRCPKKTKAFIDNGWTTPDNLQFNARLLMDTYRAIPIKNEALLDIVDQKYNELFANHPLQQPLNADSIVDDILRDPRIVDIFDLK